MRIRANISNGYPMVYELKQTHVLNQDGHALMEQVINISHTYDLNPEETIGYVMYRLHPRPLQFQPQAKPQTIRIDYTDTDTAVDDWYAETNLSNNQLSTQFILMWMRLIITYGNSLSELLYLLTQVDEDADWTPQIMSLTGGTPTGMPMTGMAMPSTQPTMPTPMVRPQTPPATSTTPTTKHHGIRIKKGSRPVSSSANVPRSSATTPVTNTSASSSVATTETSNDVNQRIARLEAKRKQIEDTDKETDDVIRQNPMFAQFYNRNDK